MAMVMHMRVIMDRASDTRPFDSSMARVAISETNMSSWGHQDHRAREDLKRGAQSGHRSRHPRVGRLVQQEYVRPHGKETRKADQPLFPAGQPMCKSAPQDGRFRATRGFPWRSCAPPPAKRRYSADRRRHPRRRWGKTTGRRCLETGSRCEAVGPEILLSPAKAPEQDDVTAMGFSSPTIVRRIVVFPAPFGTTIARRSVSPRPRSTPCSTALPSRATHTSRSLICSLTICPTPREGCAEHDKAGDQQSSMTGFGRSVCGNLPEYPAGASPPPLVRPDPCCGRASCRTGIHSCARCGGWTAGENRASAWHHAVSKAPHGPDLCCGSR